MTSKCCLCYTDVEDVTHIISSCEKMSAMYYLPLTHDASAKYVLKAIIKKNHPNSNVIDKTDPEYIMKIDDFEYWYNLSIKTGNNIPNNKPDMIVWDKSNEICRVIKFSCSADTNITSKVKC